MEKIRRIGVSLSPDLLEQLDDFVDSKGFPSRSEAIRDMVSDRLSAEGLKNPNDMAVGSITILYSHHARGLSDKLTDFQHQTEFHDLIISTTHVHIDEDLCLEIIACMGRAGDIRSLADSLGAIKGVRHGGLSLYSMSTGTGHPHRHRH